MTNAKLILFVMLVALGRAPFVAATTQGIDEIAYDKISTYTIDYPLNSLLRSLEIKLKMDTTGNYDGYTAGWRIKDDKLLLTKLDLHKNATPAILADEAVKSLIQDRLQKT